MTRDSHRVGRARLPACRTLEGEVPHACPPPPPSRPGHRAPPSPRTAPRSRARPRGGPSPRLRVRHLPDGPSRRRGRAAGPEVSGHAGASGGRHGRTMRGWGGAPAGLRAGIAWLHRTCGTCRFCTSGRENLCETPEFTGWTTDGGFAELRGRPRGVRLRAAGTLRGPRGRAAPLRRDHRLPRAEADGPRGSSVARGPERASASTASAPRGTSPSRSPARAAPRSTS